MYVCVGEECQSCSKLKEWTNLHIDTYCKTSTLECPLQICQIMKVSSCLLHQQHHAGFTTRGGLKVEIIGLQESLCLLQKQRLKQSFRQRDGDIENVLQRANLYENSLEPASPSPSNPVTPVRQDLQLASSGLPCSLSHDLSDEVPQAYLLGQKRTLDNHLSPTPTSFNPNTSISGHTKSSSGCYHKTIPVITVKRSRKGSNSQKSRRAAVLYSMLSTDHLKVPMVTVPLHQPSQLDSDPMSCPSPPPADHREVSMAMVPLHQPSQLDSDLMSFARHTSLSSHASSSDGRYKKTRPVSCTTKNVPSVQQLIDARSYLIGHVRHHCHDNDDNEEISPEEQRELIQQVIARKFVVRRGEGGGRGGRGGGGRGMVSVDSQASCGDAALHRLDSMLGMESSIFTTSPETSPHEGDAEDEDRKPVRKSSSNHRLERMSNISDGSGMSMDSSPKPHRPIQREQTEVERRFVRGTLGNSITKASSSLQSSSDEELEVGSVVSALLSKRGASSTKRGLCSSVDSGEELSCPVQRTASVSRGGAGKILFERLSIAYEQYEKIRQVRVNPFNIHSEHRHEQQQSCNMSKISSPPSLSPGTSEGQSQYSSLGDSGVSGGREGEGKATTPSSSVDHTPSSPPSTLKECSNQFTLSGRNEPSSSNTLLSHDTKPLSHDRSWSPPSCPEPQPSNPFHDDQPSIIYPYGNHNRNTEHRHGDLEHCCDAVVDCHDDQDHRHGDNDNCQQDSTGAFDPHIFHDHWTHHREGSELSYESSHSHHDSISESECSVDTSWTSPAHLSRPPASLVTREEIERMVRNIDQVREMYREDILLMKNRNTLMPQQTPQATHPSHVTRQTVVSGKGSVYVYRTEGLICGENMKL